MSLLRSIFGRKRTRRAARIQREVNEFEPVLRALSNEDLQKRSQKLRALVRGGTSLETLLSEAFAVVREAARRTLGLRHFDVQLLGGLALHDGLIAEMKTGEGKTLAATLPVYVNALAGKGVHVVTVNDYLAQRDADWMGPVYRFLGLTVGVILEEMGDDEDEELRNRRAAYRSDVTYGTNSEIAFDYLRDNLATVPEETVHRGFHYAIVDEVDFLLLDEARTPLIISGPAREDRHIFREVDHVTRCLRDGRDYMVKPKTRNAVLTEAGCQAVSDGLGVGNLFRAKHLDLWHAVHQSVIAHGAYQRDVDYIVEDGKVVIVDEFTGRVSPDKRYADGLHQAIEAKEGVQVESEDQTLAKVTYQTFFGRYQKLAGMTGTAWSARKEFQKTYGRNVDVIPTHRRMIRGDYQDIVYDTMDEKHKAIVQEILGRRGRGQPVLVGTTSVRESEQLSERLKAAGVPHSVLNAKNHRSEAEVIAQAGRKGAVTISTNMAGRGTDIILGGNPHMMGEERPREASEVERLAQECAREREGVLAAGGLHVIGTSMHESLRIDDQLRGRAGRQGDPGSSQFIVSLDDAIWKKFGKTKIGNIRADLQERGHARDEPVDLPQANRILWVLQKKVADENEAIRRDVLKYDLVVHAQRETIYGWRGSLVADEGFDAMILIRDFIDDLIARHQAREDLGEAIRAHFHEPFELSNTKQEDLKHEVMQQALALHRQREERMGAEVLREQERLILLQAIDDLWTEHLFNLELAEESIGLRGFAELDPVVEWKKETARMWEETLQLIRSRAINLWFLAEIPPMPPSGAGHSVR
ncbi:MAG: preprotein translocase subunit SecA [Planctomycetota bacterium]|jgi:preprotein translocase subunit SecA